MFSYLICGKLSSCGIDGLNTPRKIGFVGSEDLPPHFETNLLCIAVAFFIECGFRVKQRNSDNIQEGD